MLAGTVAAMTTGTPFPHEDTDHPTTRPTRRRPTDPWDAELAKLEAELDITDPAEPFPAYKHGDPIMRVLITAALVIAVVFLSAAVTRGRYSPHVILGCFAAALITCAAGWAAYAITDRKPVQP